jgi:nucleoside-diphosphate-sugar epimerase
MKVLITGGNGFIGSHLVEALYKKDYEIICIVRKSSNLKWIKNIPVKFIYGDITKKESIGNLIKNENIDYIYHVAGITKAVNYNLYEEVNFIGTKNLLDAVSSSPNRIKKFIYLSSLAAAGPSKDGSLIREDFPSHPVSKYGMSKRKGEEIAISYMERIPVTIVRPTAIYGPRDRDLLQMFKLIKKGIIPLIGKERYIDLCHVEDLINGIILAGEKDSSKGNIFFISSGKVYPWSYIGKLSASIMGVKARVVHIPISFLYATAMVSHIWAKIFNNPTIINMDKFKEIKERYWICDISKAKSCLGYDPKISLEDGFRETFTWYEKNGWL